MKVNLEKIKQKVADDLNVEYDVVHAVWVHGWKKLATCLFRGHDVRIRNVISFYTNKKHIIHKTEEQWKTIKRKYLPRQEC